MGVAEFFDGQTILITGATGFLGKVLVEKILRSCPGVVKVYLAVREKKGISPEQRWAQLSSVPVFERVKKELPEAMNKVQIINADLKMPNLGISEADQAMLMKEVTIVYHVAATVQFADNVIDTLTQNTRATYYLLELSKKIQNLVMFVYVSTTYCNFFRPETDWDEKIYPAVQDWRVLLKLMDKEPLHLAMLKEKLLCGHPNPYTFSKSIAEQIVYDYRNELPTLVVRPSIVMSSIHEPIPGWIDSVNNIAALCVANSLGILRVARHSDKAHQDYIPVDLVAKCLLAATYYSTKKPRQELPLVYNCTIGKLFTMRTSEISRVCEKEQFIEKCPSKYVVWTRNLQLIENPYKYYILFLFYQLIPAIVLDTALRIHGSEPIFIKIAQKLANASKRLFKDFSQREVHFPNEKYIELLRQLSKEDLKVFGSEIMLDPSKISTPTILYETYIGILKYFFKEDLSEKSIAKNKMRYNRIRLASKALNVVWYSTTAYLVYSACLLCMVPYEKISL